LCKWATNEKKLLIILVLLCYSCGNRYTKFYDIEYDLSPQESIEILSGGGKYEVEMYWLKVEPPFKPLYNDPRWQEMLDKVGFPK